MKQKYSYFYLKVYQSLKQLDKWIILEINAYGWMNEESLK